MSRITFLRAGQLLLALSTVGTGVWAQQVPIISSVSPVSAAPAASGSGNLTLAVYGANLTTNSYVVFDGTVLGSAALLQLAPGGGSLRVLVPPALLTPHVAKIFVVNSASALSPGGTTIPLGGRSNTFFFPVAPSLSAFGLDSGAQINLPSVQTIVGGDVNGDGSTDVVVGLQDGTVQTYLNDGSGHFTKAGTPPAALGVPLSMALSDFNGDGKLDLVLGEFVDGVKPCVKVRVLIGDGAGGFTGSTTVFFSYFVKKMGGFVAADFNQDGAIDAGLALGGGGDLHNIQGDGAGNTKDASSVLTGSNSNGIAVGDFNGDTIPDVLVVDSTDNTVRIFKTLISGGIGFFLPGKTISAGPRPNAVVAGDFNGDGMLDFATLNGGDGSVSVFFGDNAGNFTLGPTVSVKTTISTTGSMVSGDFNADGKLDVAVHDGSKVQILLGDGTGNFSLGAIVDSAGPALLAEGDFDGDGYLDLFGGNGGGILAYLVKSRSTSPIATVTPTSVNFGDITINSSSAPQTVTVTNTGGGTLTISNVSISGAGFSIGTNTCTSTLAAGASCTVVVSFSPTVAGAATGALVFTDNSSSGTTQTVSLTGNGVGGPIGTASPSTIDFGTVAVGSTTPTQTVTLTNTGTGSLTISQVAIAGAGFVIGTNGCSAPLASGQSCTVTLYFAPTAAGAASGSLTFTDNSITGPTQAVILSGNGGGAPGISVTPASLAFGNQNLGATSAGQTITVKNTGTATLNISSITWIGADFAISSNACGSSLAPSAMCMVTVTFTPTATGALTGTVVVVDAVGTQTVVLSGTGVGTPAATITPTSLTFANQNVGTTSASQTITLKNTGSGPLNITSVTGSGPFTVSSGCSGSLAPGAMCMVTVSFAPTAAGSASGTVTFVDDAGTQTVSLSGTGVGTPTATITPTSLTFANQNVGTISASQTITLKNTGSGPLNITSVTGSGPFTVSSACSGSLASGAMCMVTVSFAPTAAGSASGTVTFVDDAGTQTVSLSGTGVGTPTATITPTSLTFGNQNVGTTSASQTITLKNTGSGPLNITSVTGGGPFTLSSACSGALAPGAMCMVTVSFAPTAAGSASGTVTFVDDAGTQTVSLSGTGVGTPKAMVTPASLNFGDQMIGTTSAPKAITLKNTGTGPLNISSITISTASLFGVFSLSNGCGSSLAPGAMCMVNVTFSPDSTLGASAVVTFVDDAGTQTVSVVGNGIGTPVAVVTPTLINFGNQNVGTTSGPQIITLKNTGTGMLNIASVVGSGGPFAIRSTCGTALASGGMCTVTVTFTPTNDGLSTGSVVFTDNSAGSPQVVTLYGSGVKQTPRAVVSPGSLMFGTQKVGTTSGGQTVSLSNTGTGTLNIGSIVTSGDFAIAAKTCGTSLAPGGTCTVQVVFSPTAAGTRSGMLTFTDNSVTGSTQVVSLSGTGINVTLRLAASPGALYFKHRFKELCGAETVTISNTGDGAVRFAAISISGANAGNFAIRANTCGAGLNPGASCSVTLSFAGSGKGSFSAQLNVNSDAPPVVVGLFGMTY